MKWQCSVLIYFSSVEQRLARNREYSYYFSPRIGLECILKSMLYPESCMLIMQPLILKVYMYHSKALHKVYFIPCHKKYRNNTINVTYTQQWWKGWMKKHQEYNGFPVCSDWLIVFIWHGINLCGCRSLHPLQALIPILISDQTP